MSAPLASPAAAAAPGARSGTLRWAALGDSFTAGTEPGERVWPQLVLAAAPAGGCRLQLENRARAGATLAEVIATQLPAAIEAGPDLVTVICGGNDVIGSVRPSLDRLGAELDRLWTELRAELPEAALLTATYPPIAPAALRPRTRERIERGLEELNAILRAAAARAGVRCVELEGHPGCADRTNYADDGIHPSAAGHREAAAVLGPEIAQLIQTQRPDIDREDPAR